MKKKEFIWLGIRFLGIIQLVTSFDSIIKAIGLANAMILIMPASMPTEILSSVALLGEFVRCIIDIAIFVYLLFFGGFIICIVHRTSALELDSPLQKQNYPEILIRCLGVWWLWKILRQIFRLISGTIYGWVLTHPEWLSSYAFLNISDETREQLNELIEPVMKNLHWFVLSNVILYGILAWYFLKHGKFFINLLNRLWLKASGNNNNNLNQNPVDPVNPV